MSQITTDAAALGHETALVIGGSLAGLLAARVLIEHCREVTLVERDPLPDRPASRRGAPQAYHQHALLKRGRLIVEQLFPGLHDELLAAGAPALDMAADMAWLTPAGWAARFPSEFLMLTCSRDLLEWAVRRRLLASPRVRLLDGARVTGLLPRGDGRGIAGVTVRRDDSGAAQAVRADLVVDASGRGSRTPQWLEALGYERPEETVISSRLGYASRIYRRAAVDARDHEGVYVQPAPPRFVRGGIVLPLEGGRWHVTLAGGSGDYPPTDAAGFEAFARSLRTRLLHEVVRHAEPLSPVHGTRATENRRRHYERMTRWPDGLVVVGDAACAFNPVYAQGMTTAAVGAMTLDECLRERHRAHGVATVGRRFQRRLARATTAPWMLATSEDCRYDGVEGGARDAATRLMHRYMDRVIARTTERADVRRVLLEVFHMLRPPSALFRPSVLAQVLRPAAARGAQPTTAPCATRDRYGGVPRRTSSVVRMPRVKNS